MAGPGSRPSLKETVVVEGRDDEAAVLRAVDAGVICTHGFGLREQTVELIRSAFERCGIIILTDPDHAGETIRNRLTALFPGAKQAFLSRADAARDGDIGVENASPEAIRAALAAAKAQGAARQEKEGALRPDELVPLGLAGRPESAQLRRRLGRMLGIGDCNARTFAKRLESFGISREEFFRAWSSLRDRE